MENIGYITLENLGELAEFYDVDTGGRSAIAIEADIKKGISTVVNGFKKILNILAGWCKKAFYAITKKETCAVNPKLYTIGQNVISHGKNLVKLGEKITKTHERDDKLQGMMEKMDSLKSDFNTAKSKINSDSKITKIPVQTNKVKSLIHELQKAIDSARQSLNRSQDFVDDAGFRAIIKGLVAQKDVLNVFIGGSKTGLAIQEKKYKMLTASNSTKVTDNPSDKDVRKTLRQSDAMAKQAASVNNSKSGRTIYAGQSYDDYE